MILKCFYIVTLCSRNIINGTVELGSTDLGATNSLGQTDIVCWSEKVFVYYNYLATTENSVQPTLFSDPSDIIMYFSRCTLILLTVISQQLTTVSK